MTTDIADVWNAAQPAYRHEGPEWNGWAQKVRGKLWPGEPGRGSYLEWGYGGGAIYRALSDLADSYTAIDIADTPLAAAEAAGARALTPERIGEVDDASIQVVVSTACFQHFPTVDYGAWVVGELARVLEPGGTGLIQTRYWLPGDRKHVHAPDVPYAQRFLRAVAWQPDEFAELLRSQGLEVLSEELEPGVFYAWYRVRRG